MLIDVIYCLASAVSLQTSMWSMFHTVFKYLQMHTHKRTRRFIPVTAETSALTTDSNVWGALMCCFHCPSPPVPRNSLKNTISLKHLLWALHNSWWRKDKKARRVKRSLGRAMSENTQKPAARLKLGVGVSEVRRHCCITGISATEKLWAVKCQSLLHPSLRAPPVSCLNT